MTHKKHNTIKYPHLRKINPVNVDILFEFISIKSISSFDKISGNEYMTNRVQYILDKLSDFDMKIDVFHNKSRNRNYVNLYYYKDNGFEETIVFLAHHDINNTNSLNANDNSASVINLVNLIKNYDLNINKNILVAFTDAEEIVDLENNGAYHLGKKITNGAFGKVIITINLELTAHGRNIWYDYDTILNDSLKDYGAFKARTPFNDSYSLRKLNITSVCIGTVEDSDIQEIRKHGYCDTWDVCHQISDNYYNIDDMNHFLEILYKIIKNIR